MATFASAPREWSRGLWEYYRSYTRQRVAIHAAATAALTGFGLLASINRLFVAVAIAAYVLPPVYLYVAGDEFETDHESPPDENAANREDGSTDRDTDSDRDADSGRDADTDSDRDDRDTDTDSDSDDGSFDGDTDAGDADADGADADADADG